MEKKKLAIILEIIPIASLVLGFILVFLPISSGVIQWINSVLFMLAVFGFVFGIIGVKMVKGDKAVKILCILDCIAPLIVVLFYVLVFAAIGMG